MTWTVSDHLVLNANLGADWDATGARTRRLGAAAEWTAGPALTLIAERVRIGAGWTSRLGGRVPLGSAFSIDLSVARLGPRATPVYALGLNHEFAR